MQAMTFTLCPATAGVQRGQQLRAAALAPYGLAVRPFTSRGANSRGQRRVGLARAETENQEPSTSQPAAAIRPKEEEEPIWIRRERERELQAKEGKDLPFFAYLLFSAIVAIAAVGSIFEYTAGNALFGVVQPDNPLWAPILLLFIITGFPMAGYLFYRSVQAANKASEQMDKLDGY